MSMNKSSFEEKLFLLMKFFKGREPLTQSRKKMAFPLELCPIGYVGTKYMEKRLFVPIRKSTIILKKQNDLQ